MPVKSAKPHRCTDPKHDKSTGTALFGGICLVGGEGDDRWNGQCLACGRRDEQEKVIPLLPTIIEFIFSWLCSFVHFSRTTLCKPILRRAIIRRQQAIR